MLSLSESTLQEQKAGRAPGYAGRARLRRVLRDSVAYEGLQQLKRRFGNSAVLTSAWALSGEEYIVDVLVHTADGRHMQFTEPLMGFPSDVMIAQIALVT